MSDERELWTFSEANLSKNEIESIGLIAAEWGYVETSIEGLIWRLAHIDIISGQCITTHLTSVTKKDILKTLINEVIHDDDIKTKLNFISSEFERLRLLRNEIIHALWIRQESDAVASSTTARGKLKLTHKKYDSSTLHLIANEMALLIQKIWEGYVHLQDLPSLNNRLLAELVRKVPDPDGPKKK